jgi:hypothetical protein
MWGAQRLNGGDAHLHGTSNHPSSLPPPSCRITKAAAVVRVRRCVLPSGGINQSFQVLFCDIRVLFLQSTYGQYTDGVVNHVTSHRIILHK